MAESALAELIARIGAQRGAAVFIDDAELSGWPTEEVAALKSQGLLTKARPAASAICPGCEQSCAMPVHTIGRAGAAASAFIVCDKRSDINRVSVSASHLARWRCDADAMRAFIADRVGIRLSHRPDHGGSLEVGMARGAKRSQMLSLRVDQDVAVVAGSNAVPLVELIGFKDGAYSIDGDMVRDLVDSATTADPRYTPSNVRRAARKLDTQARYERWQRAYRDLKRRRPHMSDVWYSQQLSKLPVGAGKDAETIRKHLKG